LRAIHDRIEIKGSPLHGLGFSAAQQSACATVTA
jgi:hypothetical protein